MRKIIIAAAVVLFSGPAIAIEPGCYQDLDLRVIDGDSVEIVAEDLNVRIAGYDTPETWRPDPACEAFEREGGERATERLQGLLESRSHELCLTNGECGHGRPCGFLAVRQGGDWIDVGAILISEDLAIPFVGEMGDWCARQ